VVVSDRDYNTGAEEDDYIIMAERLELKTKFQAVAESRTRKEGSKEQNEI
jgi:hypothetical protein